MKSSGAHFPSYLRGANCSQRKPVPRITPSYNKSVGSFTKRRRRGVPGMVLSWSTVVAPCGSWEIREESTCQRAGNREPSSNPTLLQRKSFSKAKSKLQPWRPTFLTQAIFPSTVVPEQLDVPKVKPSPKKVTQIRLAMASLSTNLVTAQRSANPRAIALHRRMLDVGGKISIKFRSFSR